jgi:hypothetical protein
MKTQLSLQKNKQSLIDFSPSPKDVIAEIQKRESDKDQKLNRETIAAALKATHDSDEGVFSNRVVVKETVEAYEDAIVN